MSLSPKRDKIIAELKANSFRNDTDIALLIGGRQSYVSMIRKELGIAPFRKRRHESISVTSADVMESVGTNTSANINTNISTNSSRSIVLRITIDVPNGVTQPTELDNQDSDFPLKTGITNIKNVFLMNCAASIPVASYQGPIDNEIRAAARRVADAWSILADEMENTR